MELRFERHSLGLTMQPCRQVTPSHEQVLANRGGSTQTSHTPRRRACQQPGASRHCHYLPSALAKQGVFEYVVETASAPTQQAQRRERGRRILRIQDRCRRRKPLAAFTRSTPGRCNELPSRSAPNRPDERQAGWTEKKGIHERRCRKLSEGRPRGTWRSPEVVEGCPRAT